LKEPIISFENFSFKYHFRNDWALSDINLSISKGEFIILTGSSGSGKSSLCYSLVGLIPFFYAGKTKGDVFIGKQKVQESSILYLSKRIGYVPQRIENTLVTPFVLTELAFPLEYRDIKNKVIKEKVQAISSKLHLNNLLASNPQKLSEGQKQQVAIACGLTSNPDIFIADEPLANLDTNNKKVICSLLAKMNREGKTIIVSTHDISHYLGVATRVIEIEEGKIVREITIKEDSEDLREITSIQENEELRGKPTDGQTLTQKTMLSAKNLTFEFPEGFRINNISFSFNEGEVVGIIGDNGSGKTTVAKLLCGLLKPKSGSIEIKGKDFKDLSWEEKAKHVSIVFQNPEIQFFEDKVDQEVKLVKEGLGVESKNSDINTLLEECGLVQYKDKNPHSLSHGEKRRLAFIAAIYHDPDIIIIDEITNGLDETNKKWLVSKICDLRNDDKTVVIISHDSTWLKDFCNRLFLLEDGYIKEIENLDGLALSTGENIENLNQIGTKSEQKILSEFGGKWHLDPRTMVVVVLAMLISSLYASNVYVLTTLLLFSISIYITGEMKLKFLGKMVFFLTIFSIIAIIIAFYSGVFDYTITSFFQIEVRFIVFRLRSFEKLFAAFVQIEVRYVVSLLLITWFFNSVSPYELAVALEKIYLPAKLVWLIISIYQFVPVLSKEATDINSVRKLKGLIGRRLNLRRQYYIMKKTLRPLIAGTLNRGIDLAESMVLKGFEPKRRKNHMLDVHIKIIDIAIIILFLAILGLVIYLTILL
jgi:energy-coupling factor transport system ATP-binding protein